MNTTNLIAIGVAGVLVIAALCTVFCTCYMKQQQQQREEENKVAIAQDEESVPNIYSTNIISGEEQQSRYFVVNLAQRWC